MPWWWLPTALPDADSLSEVDASLASLVRNKATTSLLNYRAAMNFAATWITYPVSVFILGTGMVDATVHLKDFDISDDQPGKLSPLYFPSMPAGVSLVFTVGKNSSKNSTCPAENDALTHHSVITANHFPENMLHETALIGYGAKWAWPLKK